MDGSVLCFSKTPPYRIGLRPVITAVWHFAAVAAAVLLCVYDATHARAVPISDIPFSSYPSLPVRPYSLHLA